MQINEGLNINMKTVGKFQEYFYYFILTAFVGYLYEFLLITFYYRIPFVNQGPLHGPWLLIYGIGGLLIIFILKRVVKKKVKVGSVNIMPVLTAVMILFIVAVVEYIGHWVLDVFFGLKPWDYSEKFININGRICLEDSLRFVVLGMIGMYGIVPFAEKLFKKITKKQNRIIFLVLASLFSIDIVISIILIVL